MPIGNNDNLSLLYKKDEQIEDDLALLSIDIKEISNILNEDLRTLFKMDELVNEFLSY